MLRYFKISLFLVLISQITLGQKLVNSPYSRFGPGTLEPVGTFRSMALGGAGVAIREPLNIYYQNPASYSSLDTNSFVFDFAVDYRIIGLSDGTDPYKSDDMNLHHIALAFPLAKGVGFVTGVIPYSSGYYNLINNVRVGDTDYDPIIGETEEAHKGVGSYNRFFFGVGAKVYKGLSVGANMSFFFGEIQRENRLLFLDDNNYFNNVSKEDILIRGFNFDLGAQYHFDLKDDYFTTLGVKYSNKNDYKGLLSRVSARASLYTGNIYSIDTLAYIDNAPTTITLPGTIAFGISAGKKNKFIVTADYTMSDWTTAKFIGQETFFTKSSSINLGAEIIPNKFANSNILNRVEYRVGGRIVNSHLMINNEQLKEFGITFGAGIPLRRTRSRINVFFEYGSRGGSFDNGLHKEAFYNMGLSFNFYDYWFVKRKYD